MIRKIYAALCLIGYFGLTGAAPPSISLSGVLGNSVIVTLADGSIRTLRKAAPVRDGMRLIDIEQGRAALIEIDGKHVKLVLGAAPIRLDGRDVSSNPYVVSPDARGHLLVDGAISNTRVRFLVDTGASYVSISAADARKAGIAFEKGRRGMSQTANGQVPIWLVSLPVLHVGDIVLHNVEAAVHESELPVGLLGMSALKRIELVPDGANYLLKKRY